MGKTDKCTAECRSCLYVTDDHRNRKGKRDALRSSRAHYHPSNPHQSRSKREALECTKNSTFYQRELHNTQDFPRKLISCTDVLFGFEYCLWMLARRRFSLTQTAEEACSLYEIECVGMNTICLYCFVKTNNSNTAFRNNRSLIVHVTYAHLSCTRPSVFCGLLDKQRHTVYLHLSLNNYPLLS